MHPQDFVDKQKTESVYRVAKDVHVFRIHNPVPISDKLTTRVESKVGGLFGLGGDMCFTDVIFEKNQYYGGEKINVKILCDNMKCSTAVKSFKLKFKRKTFMLAERMTGTGERVQSLCKVSKYLYQHKDVDHGCGPKSKVERVLTFDIPDIDYDMPK